MIVERVTADTHEWHPYYVWWPTKLIDGRWAIFERVERCSYMARHIPAHVPFRPFGGWCFRAPASQQGSK